MISGAPARAPQTAESSGPVAHDARAPGQRAGPELERHEGLVPAAPLPAQAEPARALKAEPRVVVGMAQHDDGAASGLRQAVEAASHEGRADPPALMPREDGHRRQPDRGDGTPGALDVDRRKQDVAHERALGDRHQRKSDGAARPERLDERGLRGPAEGELIHQGDCAAVAGQLGPDFEVGHLARFSARPACARLRRRGQGSSRTRSPRAE